MKTWVEKAEFERHAPGRTGPAWTGRSSGSAASSGSRCLHRVAKLKNWGWVRFQWRFSLFTSLHVPFSSLHPQHTPPQLPRRPISQLPFWSFTAPAVGSGQRAAGEARPRGLWPPPPNPGKERAQNEPSVPGGAGAKGCETSRSHSPKGWLAGQRASDTTLREGQSHG